MSSIHLFLRNMFSDWTGGLLWNPLACDLHNCSATSVGDKSSNRGLSCNLPFGKCWYSCLSYSKIDISHCVNLEHTNICMYDMSCGFFVQIHKRLKHVEINSEITSIAKVCMIWCKAEYVIWPQPQLTTNLTKWWDMSLLVALLVEVQGPVSI